MKENKEISLKMPGIDRPAPSPSSLKISKAPTMEPPLGSPSPVLFKLEKHDPPNRFEYCTKILQLGMTVADAARYIEKTCNELAGTGWMFKQSLRTNSSEAVLIFERVVK